MRLILASASPRRMDILRRMGLSFSVIPAAEEAPLDEALPPTVQTVALALQKARDVAARNADADAVIGADTVVALDGVLLGKPKDEADACHMLRRLSGRTHRVVTGVAVVQPRLGRETMFASVTEVTFFEKSDDELAAYVRAYDVLDKAGAYAIQDGVMVARISGDYDTVVGLPAGRLEQVLCHMGLMKGEHS